jgi:ribulose-5-phosphate 4-epimerase/fuculose-1-phosphate aldolase
VQHVLTSQARHLPREVPLSRETELRETLAAACRRLAAAELLVGRQGSISLRRDATRFLITPEHLSRKNMAADKLLQVDAKQSVDAVSTLHRAIYARRSDVSAIVWARPVYLTALAMAGKGLLSCLLPEPVTRVVPPLPTSAQEVALLLSQGNILWLERQGLVVLGASLEEAEARLEEVEAVAKTGCVQPSMAVETTRELAEQAIASMRSLGLPGALRECNGCGACGLKTHKVEDEASLAARLALQQSKSSQGRRATCGEAWWLEPE